MNTATWFDDWFVGRDFNCVVQVRKLPSYTAVKSRVGLQPLGKLRADLLFVAQLGRKFLPFD